MKRLLAALVLLALTLPSVALGADEETKFDPSEEWNLKTWGPISSSVRRCRSTRPSPTSSSGRSSRSSSDRLHAYPDPVADRTVARRSARRSTKSVVQVAEQGLPRGHPRWFPYVATLMIFIWVVNILGFIPLPLSDERWKIGGIEIPTLAIFAATSTLSVTLALALMTFVFTHVEGIRANGLWPYLKSWIPDVPKVMLPLIIPLEILGQFMRLISLSVRLYANMLAGHMLILTFIGLIFVLESLAVAVVAVPAAAAFYLFEVVIVVSIQAYIFAALSAITWPAIEPSTRSSTN
jgi:F-type H+-transporting ATPase subunit a